MDRLKKHFGVFLLAVLVFWTAAACSENFQTDLDAIEHAAKSVLMLEVYDEKENLIATGSGFVAFDNFSLVTNFHVIENADLILAISDTGKQYLINKVIAADAKKDIALLEFFSPTDLTPLDLATGNGLRRAAPVVAIGSPKGVTNSVSIGNISALYDDGGVSYVQFTAPISPGSSGGALFNNRGEVIGITSATYIDGQNMNLAVAIGEIVSLHEQSSKSSRTRLRDYLVHATAMPTPRLTATPKPTATPEPYVKAIHITASEGSIILNWDSVPQADRYKVYRSISPNAGFSLLGTVYDCTYSDDQAVPGKVYYYKVACASGQTAFKMSSSVEAAMPTPKPTATPELRTPKPKPTANNEPKYPIQFGDDGYIELYQGYPRLNPGIENISGWKTVDGFTLTYYCENANNEKIKRYGYDDYYCSYTYSRTINPGNSIYAGYVWLEGYREAKYVHVAITKIHTSDGDTITIPESEWHYYYWTIN